MLSSSPLATFPLVLALSILLPFIDLLLFIKYTIHISSEDLIKSGSPHSVSPCNMFSSLHSYYVVIAGVIDYLQAESVPGLGFKIFPAIVWGWLCELWVYRDCTPLGRGRCKEPPFQCRLAAWVQRRVLFIFVCLKHCDLTRPPQAVAAKMGIYRLLTLVAKILELDTGRGMAQFGGSVWKGMGKA